MAVSREFVVWTFRTLLGREPESESIVDLYVREVDRSALVRRILKSRQFRAANPNWDARVNFLPLDLPGATIEIQATPEEEARLLARSRAAWDYFAALTPQLGGPPIGPDPSGSAEAFWQSGERDVAELERILARHGLPPLQGRTCVDFGCGIGRLTVALAARCAEVHAYDISALHLAHAKQGLIERRIGNVMLHPCGDDAIALVDAADFVVSFATLQHNPPPIMAATVRQLLAALRPGGIAILQLPTQIRKYGFLLSEFLAPDFPIGLELHCLKQADLFAILRDSGCDLLEIREDDRIDDPQSVLSNTLVVRRPDRPARTTRAVPEPVVRFPMGWDVPEDWGVWTNGDRALLTIELPTDTPASVDLDFALQVFVPFPGRSLAIEVATNAERSEPWRFSHIDYRRGEVRRILSCVPTIEKAGRRFIEVDFALTGAASPREAGLGEDDRRLGLGFKGVALRPSAQRTQRGLLTRLRAALRPES
jgi:SAM-dependent methyltransferase